MTLFGSLLLFYRGEGELLLLLDVGSLFALSFPFLLGRFLPFEDDRVAIQASGFPGPLKSA